MEEKWEEYRIAQEQKFTDGGPIEKLFQQALQRAFYAGAYAVIEANYKEGKMLGDLRAEIDHFRSHKSAQQIDF